MAKTRSQTSASGSGKDGKDQKESWKNLLKSRNLEELTNMSKSGLNQENKRQKLMSIKANDQEKDLDFFHPRSYVESSIETTGEMEKDFSKTMAGDSKVLNSHGIDIKQDTKWQDNDKQGSLVHAMKGSNDNLSDESMVLFTQEEQEQKAAKNTDSESIHSLQVAGADKDRKALVQEKRENLFISLSQNTDDITICSWPSQALVQIINQVQPYREEFPMELYTKCNSRLLRRLVIDIRNDMMDTDSDEILLTKIHKTTGIFTMHTKTWEIFGFDREDLVDIYAEFLLAQNEVMLHEIEDMSSRKIQSLLFRGQDEMNEAEIEPINVHLALPFSKADVLSQLQQIIVKATREHNLDKIDKDTDMSEDDDDVLIFVKLEKETSITIIAKWSGHLLLNILHEWHELQQKDFDEEYYMGIPSTQLRFHVVEVQKMLTKTDRIHVSIRKREAEIYSRATRDWEIEAWDSTDLAIIYKQWCKCLGRKIILKENNQMFNDLMEMNEDMVAGCAPEVKFSVQLNTNFSNCNKLLVKDTHGEEEEFQASELFATLSRSTQDYNICTWCNQSLITITAKFMNTYHIVNSHDLKTIDPRVLRKYLIFARRFLHLSKSDRKIRSAVRNLGIFHPHIEDWEIDNMSETDMILILQTAEKITEERKQMIGNSSIIALRRMIREFRDNTRRMGSLSGLQFQSEEGKKNEVQEIIKGMYVTEDEDDTVVSMLYYFDLCGKKNKQEKENKKLNKKEDLDEEEKQKRFIRAQECESGSGHVTIKEEETEKATKNIPTVTPMKKSLHSTNAKETRLEENNMVYDNSITERNSKRIKKAKDSEEYGQLRRSKRVEQLPEKSYLEEEMLEDNKVGEVLNVESTTADWEIETMDNPSVRETYLRCLQKRGVFSKLEDIQQFEIEHLRKEIFKARDQEIEIANKTEEIMQPEVEQCGDTILEDAIMHNNEDTNKEQAAVGDEYMEDVDESNKVESRDEIWESDQQENKQTPPQAHMEETKETESTIKVKSKPLQVNENQPFVGIRGRPATNLRGFHINDVQVQEQDDENVPPSTQQFPRVEGQTKMKYILRVRLATRVNSHVPSLVKKFIRVLRQADSTLQIFPFNTHSMSENDIITDEKDLPTEENQIRKWAVGIHMTRSNKLAFAIRVCTTYKFRNLKDMIFGWCGQNDCYVSFSNIESERIFRAGWIQGLHPHYHNRDRIRDLLVQSNPHLRTQISVYARTIYITNEDGTRTFTEALAVDGSMDVKNEIIRTLCRANLNPSYPGARYLPFRMSDELTENDFKLAMNYHNGYLKTIYTKTLEVKQPHVIRQSVSNASQSLSFLQWIRMFRTSNGLLFSNVEHIQKTRIRLIYHRQYERNVTILMSQLFALSSDEFGRAATETMLGSEAKFQVKADNLGVENEYAASCATFIRSLPQKKNIQPPRRPNKLSFGNPGVQEYTPTKSFASVVSPNNGAKQSQQRVVHNISGSQEEKHQQKNQSTTEMRNAMEEELRELVHKEMETMNKKNITHFEQKIENMKKNMDSGLENLKQEMETKLQVSEENLLKIFSKNQAQTNVKFDQMSDLIKKNQEYSEAKAEIRSQAQNESLNKILIYLQGGARPSMPPLVTPRAVERGSRRGEAI